MNQFDKIPNKHTPDDSSGILKKINKMPFGKALQALAATLAISNATMKEAKASTTIENIEFPQEATSSIDGLKKYADKLIIGSFPEEFQKDIHGIIIQVIDKMEKEGATNQEILNKIVSGLKNIHDQLDSITSPTK